MYGRTTTQLLLAQHTARASARLESAGRAGWACIWRGRPAFWGELGRREHLEASQLSKVEVNEILDAFAKIAVRVPLWFLWRPRLKDPADEMVLETAVNGGAGWLATFNERHLGKAVREFGIRSAPPGEVWKEVQRRNEKE